MRIKRRYFLIKVSEVNTQEDFEKTLFSVLNKLAPLLAIKSNFRVIKESCVKVQNGFLGVISVNNEYKYEAIFILSLIQKFYKSNLLTLKSSGSLKKLKMEETRHGTSTK